MLWLLQVSSEGTQLYIYMWEYIFLNAGLKKNRFLKQSFSEGPKIKQEEKRVMVTEVRQMQQKEYLSRKDHPPTPIH